METARSRVVTVAVEAFKFLKLAKVGDVVCCYARIARLGTATRTLKRMVWVKPVLRETEDNCPRFKGTEALFTYVAIDANGKMRAIPRTLVPTL